MGEIVNEHVIESRSKLWDEDLFVAPQTNGGFKRQRTKSLENNEEDQVRKMMKEMGLPTSFKSTKKSRRRKEIVDVEEISTEQVDQTEEFLDSDIFQEDEEYFEQQGYQIALDSWMSKPGKPEQTATLNEQKGGGDVNKQSIRKITEICDYEEDVDSLPYSIRGDSDEWKVVKKNKKKRSKNWLNKKKKKRPKNANNDGLIGNVLEKYWSQRYRLFSRFDEGIRLDDESWYSVTPERIADHIAARMSRYYDSDWVPVIIIDAFCGSGGNTIQFAKYCDHVIAIDIDPAKIELAKHNAKVYGVEKQIDFIVGDYLQVIKCLKRAIDLFQPTSGDGESNVRVAVFMSPPWGGPEYLKKNKFDLHDMTPDGLQIIQATRQHLTSNIAILLPRNVDQEQMIASAGEGNKIEIEKNVLNEKVKTITAYYGELIQTDDDE